MAAPAPAPAVARTTAATGRNPANLRPATHNRVYDNLSQRAKDRIIIDFLDLWTFVRPAHPAASARQLAAGTWQPKPLIGNSPLAEGGEGVVHLWVCTDDNDRIIDRVIVKEVFPGRARYDNEKFWRDGQVGGEPRESEMANQVYNSLRRTNLGDEKHTTQCLGYGDLRGRPHVRAYKLYLEYCPFGDLSQMIRRQAERRSRTWTLEDGSDDFPGLRQRFMPKSWKEITVVEEDTPFPEGFLWMLLEALAKAAVAMQRANILHGDLQAGNVLFGNPDNTRFRVWPVPKVSDFGSARFLDDRAKSRVGALEELCALRYAAPELARINNHNRFEVPDMDLSTKTNVWQIGMLLCCAMRLQRYLPENDWRDEPAPPPDVAAQQLRFSIRRQRRIRRLQHADASYSNALRGLVRRCVRFSPNRRPSPRNLLREVQRHMQNHVDGMDTYAPPPGETIPSTHEQKITMDLEDRFEVGNFWDGT